MVGGKIVDYFSVGRMTQFLVKGNGADEDYCCVMASIPEVVQRRLKEGDSIWWQHDKIFLNVFAGQDVPFKKISSSWGDAKSFYREKSSGRMSITEQ